MRNNQYIKVIRSPKYRVAKKEGEDIHDTAVQYKNKLIHEHDFITITANETNTALVRCITCGQYYCDLCGKGL